MSNPTLSYDGMCPYAEHKTIGPAGVPGDVEIETKSRRIKVCLPHLALYLASGAGWRRVERFAHTGPPYFQITPPDRLVFVEMTTPMGDKVRKVLMAPWNVGMGDTVVAYFSHREVAITMGVVSGLAEPTVLPHDKPPRRIIGKVDLA